MYYVPHGSIPQQRHTQHRAPDGSLYAEELFGVEGFTGRSSLLYHLVPPTQTHKIEPVREIRLEAADEGPSPPPDQDRRRRPRGDVITGRIPLYFNNDVVFGVVRPAEAMPDGHVLPQRRSPTRCSSSTRAPASATRSSGRCATAPATTSSCRSGRPGASIPTRAQSSGSCTSRRRPRSSRRKRYRNDYGQLLEHSPYSQRDLHAPEDVAAARRARRLRHPRPVDRPDHGLPLPPPPVRRRRLGRLPVAVPVQHRRLPADHRPRPPAAAGPPDVPGAELRRLLVRAPQVRLPPARDPGAVQPLEHQQRRGHLLRRRQLHEPPRRRDRLVHPPPGRDPARPAPGHGRGVDRQGGDRGARGHGRHVPPAQAHEGRPRARRPDPTRTRGCRPTTTRRKPPSSRSEARRRSRTDPRGGQSVGSIRSVSTMACISARSPAEVSGNVAASMTSRVPATSRIQRSWC